MTGIKDESLLLDEKFRLRIIEEMTSPENVERKKESLRRYDIYKDNAKKWVIEALAKEFSKETLNQVKNRASNISILKKVVNKLARAYSGGATRTGVNEAHTKAIDHVSHVLNVNQAMKKSDRYLRLQWNAFLACLPVYNYRESLPDKPKYDLHLRVFCPHSYDVIPDSSNPEVARAVILTDFTEGTEPIVQPYMGADGRTPVSYVSLTKGDSQEETIAINKDDKGKEHRTFIWWSDSYHFTTDDRGKIIEPSPEDLLNPIGEIPGEFLSYDKDGWFWSDGGYDLVDGAVMLNIQLTDLYTIANVQGWGQPVISGKISDKSINGGPHRALILTHEEGEPEPKFYYASSNPPLDQHMSSIEMTAALYLSTNNLSPSNVAGKLDANTFPSGIAKMVEDAQSTEPVEDSQQYFKEIEPRLWKKIAKWHDRLSQSESLTESLVMSQDGTPVVLPVDAPVSVLFQKQMPVISEGEKLQNLKLRKEIGISSTLDLIMRDNPGMSKEEAQAKLEEIESENKARMERVAPQMVDKKGEDDDSEDDQYKQDESDSQDEKQT